MTPKQIILRAQAIERERPDAKDLYLGEAKRQQAARIEGDKELRLRMPSSQKEEWLSLESEIGAHIGTQAKEQIRDWMLAELRHALQRELEAATATMNFSVELVKPNVREQRRKQGVLQNPDVSLDGRARG